MTRQTCRILECHWDTACIVSQRATSRMSLMEDDWSKSFRRNHIREKVMIVAAGNIPVSRTTSKLCDGVPMLIVPK